MLCINESDSVFAKNSLQNLLSFVQNLNYQSKTQKFVFFKHKIGFFEADYFPIGHFGTEFFLF
jgi:uncharacterized protein YwgA